MSSARRQEALRELDRLRADLVVAREWARQGFRKPGEAGTALAHAARPISTFIAAHRDCAQAYVVRAEARRLLLDFEGAESDLTEAVRREPAFGPAWNLLGQAKLQQYAIREDAELLRAAEDALRRGDDRWSEWGLAHVVDADVSTVLATALRIAVVEKDPARAAAAVRAAHVGLAAEDYGRWLSFWELDPVERLRWADEAVRIAPHDAASRVARGQAHARLGDETAAGGDRDRACVHWIAATSDYDYALEICGGSREVLICKAPAREALGDLRGAIEDYESALRGAPAGWRLRPHAERRLAELRAREGK
jgi:tetratricopeptide (TPR) repeat protein